MCLKESMFKKLKKVGLGVGLEILKPQKVPGNHQEKLCRRPSLYFFLVKYWAHMGPRLYNKRLSQGIRLFPQNLIHTLTQAVSEPTEC